MPKINLKTARRFKSPLGELQAVKVNGGVWTRPPLASYYQSNIPLHLAFKNAEYNEDGLLIGIKNAGNQRQIHDVGLNREPLLVNNNALVFTPDIPDGLVFNTPVQLYGSTLMFAIDMTNIGSTQTIFSSVSNANGGYSLRMGSVQPNDGVFLTFAYSAGTGSQTVTNYPSPRFIIPRRWAILEVDIFNNNVYLRVDGQQVSQGVISFPSFQLNQIGSGWGGQRLNAQVGEIIKLTTGANYAAALLASRQYLARQYGIAL